MEKSEYRRLEEMFMGIRDERGTHQNTAVRIGTAFLELLRACMIGEFDEIIFNKVLNKPTFLQGLISLGSIVLGDYAEGLKGGIITPEGVAELKDLWVREHAKLGDGQIHRDEAGRVIPALEVKGDSTFSGNLSSPEFVSAFLGGIGWAIQKKEFVNSAGEIEYKYTLEIDNAVIRNTLRVFEMIISQLLGENDNRVFSAMMEVHHYDPETGRVWLSTNGGRFYQCFRKDDCIMVQQYQPGNTAAEGGDGYVTKSYELLITEVGSGGLEDENGDRLDWVTFKNFATQMADDNGTAYTPEMLIAQGDTFVRVDNLTDPDRKGIVTMMTVGNNTPYMDVIYGLKTDPKHAVKSRIGNLQGIQSELFGWLESFGAYLQNFYGVGKFVNAQTGENLTARVEMLPQMFKTIYTETTYNVSDEDNFLTNGHFENDMEGWTVVNVDGSAYVAPTVGDFVTVIEQAGGQADPMLLNGEMITTRKANMADMQEVDGTKVLHLRNMGISQDFSLIKEKGQHEEMQSDDPESTETVSVDDAMYMGMRFLPLTKGKIKVRFIKTGGYETGWETELDESYNWFLMQAQDVEGDRWDFSGEGRMVISYTGECYIRFVAMTTDAVANSRYTFSTKIEQTARRITLEAARQDANLVTAKAELTLQHDVLLETVTSNRTKSDAMLATILGISVDDNGNYVIPDSLKGENMATWRISTNSTISDIAAHWDENDRLIGYSTSQQTADAISNAVYGLATSSEVSQLDSTLRQKINEDIGTINGQITQISQNIDAVDRENDQRASVLATWQEQTSASITAIAGKWDADGNLIGYSTSNQTAAAISDAVYGLAKDADLDVVENAMSQLTNETLPAIRADITDAQNTADRAWDYGYSSMSWINQNKESIEGVVAKFDSRGHLTELSGYMVESNFATLFSEALAEDGTVMKKADMGTYVKKDGNGYLESGAYINADHIDFKTNGLTIQNKGGDTTFALDSKGNLTVMGTINGGSTIGGFNIKNDGSIYWENEDLGMYTGMDCGFLSIRNKLSSMNALTIYGKVSISGYLSSGSARSFFDFEGFDASGDAKVKVVNLPISKPSTGGYLYRDSGTLKIS